MATIQIKQTTDLKEIIVETLRNVAGESRNIRDLKSLLYREHGNSLHYSKHEIHNALEHLVNKGIHLGNMSYHLRIKIFQRFLRRYEIKFWLFSVPDEYKPQESASLPTTDIMDPVPVAPMLESYKK